MTTGWPGRSRPAPARRRRPSLAIAASVTANAAGAPSATAAVTSPAAPAAAIPTTLAPDASPRFRAVAAQAMPAMARVGLPGAALGIHADGREECAAFGIASAPVADGTLFAIGSITKTYTATAVMRLGGTVRPRG